MNTTQHPTPQHSRAQLIKERLTLARQTYAAREATVKAARTRAEETRERLRHAIVVADSTLNAHKLLVELSDSRREVVRDRIERTVTAALRAVFGPAISFAFEPDIKRGVVTLRPTIGYDNGPTKGIQYMGIQSVGGGVVDVVAFALRVCVTLMRTPHLRPVIIADEPFKHVSNDHLAGVAGMLRRLADDTGLQLIIVSHEEEIADAADALFRVTRTGSPDAPSRIAQEPRP